MDKSTDLYIAARGSGPEHGLVRSRLEGDLWVHTTLATVDQLSSLAWHPTLPVLYATAGQGRVGGQVLAWEITELGARTLTDVPASAAELEPCHIAVHPTGRFVAVANYTAGQIALWRTDENGALVGDATVIALSGRGPERDRQEAAHPHQVIFVGEWRMLVVDLGADLVRVFDVRISGDGLVVTEEWSKPVPPGTGPRHLVPLPDRRYAISGELGSNLLVGRLDDSPWKDVPSTSLIGPARVRHERNYPGDIQCSDDGRYVYLANRSYGTIAVFDVHSEDPMLVTEIAAKVDWPQHILVRERDIVIAGWDSSRVSSLPLVDGIPQQPSVLFDAPGPGWIVNGRAL